MAKYKKVKRYHRSFYSPGMWVKKAVGIIVLVAVVLVVGWLAAPHVLDWATHTWYTVVRNRDLSASSETTASSAAASSEVTAEPAASSEVRVDSEPESEPAAPAGVIIEGSWGVLDTAAAKDEASLRAAAQQLAQQGAVYAVVTLKDSAGNILYPSQVAAAAGSIEGASLDPALIASVLKENSLVPVAKLAAFRDPIAARTDRNMAIGYTGQAYLWLDNKASAGGNPWLNPYSDEAVQFIGDLIGEVQSMGFDHVLLENVQFPSAQNGKQDFGSTGGRDRSAQLAADIAAWDARFEGSVTLWYGYSLGQVTDGASTVGGSATALGVRNLVVEVPAKQTMDDTARNSGGDVSLVMDEDMCIADSIEELAEMIGLDPETVAATVAEYNDLCASGADDPRFGRFFCPPLTGAHELNVVYLKNTDAGHWAHQFLER